MLMAIVGGVLSRLTGIVAVLDLSAWSVTVPEISCALPSVVTETGAGQLTMSDTLSAHVKLTVTSDLFHPAALGVGVKAAVIDGAVFSRLMVVMMGVVLPALSLTEALICWALPSVLTILGRGHKTMPDNASEHK